MLDGDFIDFLLSKQGQSIAVRIDPQSPVWNIEKKQSSTKSILGDYAEVSSNLKVSSKYLPDNPFGAPGYFLGMIKAGGNTYLITSALKIKVPFVTEDDMNEFLDPSNPESMPVEQPLTSHDEVQPVWAESIGYSFKAAKHAFSYKCYYALDHAMQALLANKTLMHKLAGKGNGNLVKIFKLNNKGEWVKQQSHAAIMSFCHEVAASAKMKSHYIPHIIKGYPAYLDVTDLPTDYMDFNIIHIENHMNVKIAGTWYRAASVQILWPMLLNPEVSAKSFISPWQEYLKSMSNKEQDTKTTKFLKDNWHIYTIPDVGLRAEDDESLVELFDEFIQKVVARGVK